MPDFSSQSTLYARFRPRYPAELYDFIYRHLPGFSLAWDAGTGNGQVAAMLAKRFEKVVATDTSERQLAEAVKDPVIEYRLEAAERTSLPDASADLVMVAQAVHWFDFEAFYGEVRRVIKPGGLLVLLGYGMFESIPALDELIAGFYKNTTGPYWDPRRSYIEAAYRTIPFPFEELNTPPFYMEMRWNASDIAGYLNTWSAVQAYIKVNGRNPVDDLENSIRSLIGRETLNIRFPLFLRMANLQPAQ